METFSDNDGILHIVIRSEDFSKERTEVIAANEFLQLALLNLNKGKTFRPHKHVERWMEHRIKAQESWVVLSGSVKAILYDTENKIIAEPILRAGDASITLHGGHTYEILEDNTRVMEFKTGPYHGQALDKEFID
jgi:cupin fold WbuC family metalloprotein